MYSCYFWQEVISLSPDGPLHQPLVGLWDGQAMRRTFLADIQALDVALWPKVRRDLSGEKAQTVVAVSALHCEPWCRMCAISLCRLPLCSIWTFRTVMVNKYYDQIYSLYHLQLLFYVKTLFYLHISSERTLSYLPCQWVAPFLVLQCEHLAEFFAAGVLLGWVLWVLEASLWDWVGQMSTFHVGNLFKVKQVFELKQKRKAYRFFGRWQNYLMTYWYLQPVIQKIWAYFLASTSVSLYFRRKRCPYRSPTNQRTVYPTAWLLWLPVKGMKKMKPLLMGI